jgi:hypothetical protein
MHDAGKDMFSGMLLHQIKPAVPVNHAMNGFTDRQRLSAAVQDHTVLPAGVRDFGLIQKAVIAWLSPAFRIKCGLTQLYVKAFPAWLTG